MGVAGRSRASQHARELSAFAAFVLIVNVSGLANQQTALGAVIFFWARLAHAVLYIAGIWKLRWIAFFTAWGGELLIIFRLLLH